MRVGDVANEGAQQYGKPLDGVRVLALEQMAAMPFATQLLARLGADVVKVEHPVHGESGRAASPSILDPDGRVVGATFLRSNLGKRSVGIDLQDGRGTRARPATRAEVRRVRGELQSGHDRPPRPRPRRRVRCAPRVCLRLGVGIRRGSVRVRRLARVRVDRRGDVGDLRLHAAARRTATPEPGRGAGRHLDGVVRGDRRARRAAPSRRHRVGTTHRHGDVRRDRRDDGHRAELLLARLGTAAVSGAVPDHVVQGQGWLVRHADGARAPVRRARPTSSGDPSGRRIRASPSAPDGTCTSRRTSGPRSRNGPRR